MPASKNISIAKILGAAAALAFVIWYLQQPYQSTTLDAFDLLMHEAGHWIFAPFGIFMAVLGGSLNQALIPLLFICYFFFWQKDGYSASLLLVWLGINLVNVSVYAADAVGMRLPLLGGENSTHDWNWLLLYAGQLHHTAAIAGAIRNTGLLAIITGLIAAFWLALKNNRSSNAQNPIL